MKVHFSVANYFCWKDKVNWYIHRLGVNLLVRGPGRPGAVCVCVWANGKRGARQQIHTQATWPMAGATHKQEIAGLCVCASGTM